MDDPRRPVGVTLAAWAPPREGLAMTTEDLVRITARARDLLGIDLGEGKRQMVYSRLSRRLRLHGLTRFSDYLDLLDGPAGAAEAEPFANALTTNLTGFFREPHHFEHFEREVRRAPADRSRRLRIWSAGCSTGEEAFSLAMVLHANADALAGRDRRILGSDVDTDVIAAAGRGAYSADRLKTLPARFRGPAFLVPGEGAIAEPVRKLVVFRTLNLVGPWPFKGAFDAIFCRNVLIYLVPELRARTIDRFVALLRPGGLLYLGHSESILASHPMLVAEGRTIYRRVAE